MQSVSTTYRALLAVGAPKEVRARIAGVTYGQDKIVSATTHSAMLGADKPIGNCIAKELNLVLRNPGAIPRMAGIEMQFRLNNGPGSENKSEWISKGTYFIDTRDLDPYGVLTISAFDPMLKTERSFTTNGDQGNWPRSDYTVVYQIAAKIGVTVDSRTSEILTKGYEIPYPGYGEGAYTMREMLGYIGQAYAGNWVITDTNELRLIVYGDIPAGDTNLLVTEGGEYITMGGYQIRVSR